MHDIVNRLRAKKQDEGFTLIELLVVVVIIGVLVAIAVPVYLNYRQGAADKSAQSDARGAISAVEQFYTNNNNTYPATIATTTAGTNITLNTLAGGATTTATGTITVSDKTQLGYNYVAATQTYIICANNTGGSGKWYKYDSSVGGSVKASTAATPAVTSC
jgi:type IV pilus assembly protein PilA